jgi:putative two-component system response regulator
MAENMKNSLLIVDDDPFNLTLLTEILKSDYTVRALSSGKACIGAAEKFLPDLILLDVMMPEMDGYQVFEALKSTKTTAHIPIIFITGLDNKSDEKKGLQLGAADYISKPFDDVIIKLKINQQIRNINQLRMIEQLNKEIESLKNK